MGEGRVTRERICPGRLVGGKKWATLRATIFRSVGNRGPGPEMLESADFAHISLRSTSTSSR